MGSELLWLLGGLLLGSVGTAVFGQQAQRRSDSRTDSSAPDPSTERKSVKQNSLKQGDGEQCTVLLSEHLAYYQALELAQFKGGFLARSAHELRSPLSSLMGLHQLILTDLCDSPEEERDCVAQAYEAAQNFFALLESIIEVSKLDAGTRTLKLQSFPLSTMLDDVGMAVALPFRDRNVRLVVDNISPDNSVEADYDTLRQVMVQLLLLMLELKPSTVILEQMPSAEHPSPLAPIQLRLRLDEQKETWQEDLSAWQELRAQDLPSLTPDLIRQWKPKRLSPGFSLMLQQSLLEIMGGGLEAGENGSLLCWMVQGKAESAAYADTVRGKIDI